MSLISKPITRRALVRGGTLLIGAAALPTLPLVLSLKADLSALLPRRQASQQKERRLMAAIGA